MNNANEDHLARIRDDFHEAAHGQVAEGLDLLVEITIPTAGQHLDPNAIVHPRPTDLNELALIAMAGPIGEALALNNSADPSNLTVRIALHDEAKSLIRDFASSVVEQRTKKHRAEYIPLKFKMSDATDHSVNVGYPDYDYLPGSFTEDQIVQSIIDAVTTVQDNWQGVVRIADILKQTNSYSTMQYKDLPPEKA